MPEENQQNNTSIEQRVEALEKKVKKVQITAGVALGLAMTTLVLAIIF